jgi:hypothetical protein
MNYRAMPLECYCGERPDQILEIGFTSDRHMVVHYWCRACNRVIFMSRTLEECHEMCPEPSIDEALTASEDAAFLASLGIRTGK